MGSNNCSEQMQSPSAENNRSLFSVREKSLHNLILRSERQNKSKDSPRAESSRSVTHIQPTKEKKSVREIAHAQKTKQQEKILSKKQQRKNR